MKDFENGNDKQAEEATAENKEKTVGSKITVWPGTERGTVRREKQSRRTSEEVPFRGRKMSGQSVREKPSASSAERREAVGSLEENSAAGRTATERNTAYRARAAARERKKEEQNLGSVKSEVLRTEIRRKRQEEERISLRTLYLMLGILSVILVIALVGQEYYGRVTYKKGELAALAEGKTVQRKRFMTEAAEENGQASESVPKEAGEPQKDSTELPAVEAETVIISKTEESAAKTAVETSESVNLKNQLIGVLPGILPPGQTSAELIAQADRLAAMYDYDKATELLQNCDSYEQDLSMQEAAAGYQQQKAACVEYPIEQITHVFFHTLIKDADKAFDGDQYEDGYNQYMVTIDEFNSIIQQMYEKGYVMVTLEDMAVKNVNEDGSITMEKGKILLPKGKIPFVLSQDDVSYYHYMDGDGFASKLIIDENGDVKNEYIESDGSISVGDYDMVPLIDTFLDSHPDFSYRGAKGYVALTGYDGILGYRTDICYKTRENLTSYQEQFFQEHPNFSEADYERECEESKKVAEAMKADGWRFASHTWGHVGLGENRTTIEQFKTDTDKWEERVEPLIGETDTLIYAFGGDIGGAEEYSGQRYEYLKSKGFYYFCGVDSAEYWVQLRDGYLRQARRNLDGYRMYYNPEMLDDLFDVSKAWDPKRPDYVPQI